MCTRYVLTNRADAIRDLFRIPGPMPNWPPNYNVAPTHIMPIVRSNKERIDREIAMAEWGMVPWFSKDGARQVEHLQRTQ
jgi:putative SOS response-associated peptidase YedK